MQNLYTDAIHETLHGLLTSVWSAETSADAAWSPDVPERGQCAVTALIVQDIFGGSLLRGTVDGVSHYWNRLPGCQEVDLTRAQFPGEAVIVGAEERDRKYVLSSEATARRYELLAEMLLRDI